MKEDITGLCMIQLELVVRVAALPAEEQIKSFPKSVVVADEIALDYDHWCRWALEGQNAPQLTDEQRSGLIAFDSRFERMSGERNAHLWTEDALRYRHEWNEVRQDAQTILNLFGWSVDE